MALPVLIDTWCRDLWEEVDHHCIMATDSSYSKLQRGACFCVIMSVVSEHMVTFFLNAISRGDYCRGFVYTVRTYLVPVCSGAYFLSDVVWQDNSSPEQVGAHTHGRYQSVHMIHIASGVPLTVIMEILILPYSALDCPTIMQERFLSQNALNFSAINRSISPHLYVKRI